MRRWWVVFMLLIGLKLSGFALDLPVLKYIEMDISQSRSYYQLDSWLYLEAFRGRHSELVKINLGNLVVEPCMVIGREFGTVNNRIMLGIADERQNAHYKLYDPRTQMLQDYDINRYTPHWILMDYQNNSAFTSVDEIKGEGEEYRPWKYDFARGTKERLGPRGVSIHLTPDKLHLLVEDAAGENLRVWSLAEKRVIGEIRWKGGFFTLTRFLTNSFVLVFPKGTEEGEWKLYSLFGQLVDSFPMRVGGSGEEIRFLWVSSDLTRAVGCTQSVKTVILDTNPLRTRLQEAGFLFQPTTAVCTESRVRVRENPNLEAQTFGFLEKEEALEVTDRSGVKVKVGELEDWWYRVKRKSDGLEGWSYGAFLQLAQQQGPIGAP